MASHLERARALLAKLIGLDADEVAELLAHEFERLEREIEERHTDKRGNKCE